MNDSVQTPALRSDDVGLLARKLIGAVGETPDLTAAPALVDSLRDNGMHSWADATLSVVAEIYVEWFPKQQSEDTQYRPDGPPTAILPRLVRERLEQRLGALLYDFASLCGLMAAQLGPTTAEASKTELATLKVNLMPGMSVGQRLQLPDGRPGLIISVDGRDRVAHVVPLEPTDEERGGMPMAQQAGMAMRRSTRRFA